MYTSDYTTCILLLYFQKIKRKLSSDKDDLANSAEEGKFNEATFSSSETTSISKLRKTEKGMSRPGRLGATESSKTGPNEKVS